jgi:hypothetical protein
VCERVHPRCARFRLEHRRAACASVRAPSGVRTDRRQTDRGLEVHGEWDGEGEEGVGHHLTEEEGGVDERRHVLRGEKRTQRPSMIREAHLVAVADEQ